MDKMSKGNSPLGIKSWGPHTTSSHAEFETHVKSGGGFTTMMPYALTAHNLEDGVWVSNLASGLSALAHVYIPYP